MNNRINNRADRLREKALTRNRRNVQVSAFTTLFNQMAKHLVSLEHKVLIELSNEEDTDRQF